MQLIKSTLVCCNLLFISTSAFAVDDINIGKISSVGKVGGTACSIKIPGSTFTNTCPTATYELIYFDCTSNEGKATLSLALSAYHASKNVRAVSTACATQYGSSVANIVNLYLE